MREDWKKDQELLELLKLMAPGTPMRDGLENILRARTGGLIVIGDSQEVMDTVDGGFLINKEYSAAHLYELAKMDGAIILSKDMKKIIYANTLLVPDTAIPTEETGTRHKSAERIAKQTGEIVVCISQRRNIITLYKGYRKYILRDTAVIVTRANQALQTLEKYKTVLDGAMSSLSLLEFEDYVTLQDVILAVQRTEMVMRVVAEIDRYICELGNEGRLISMQLEELLPNVEEDERLVIEDYINSSELKSVDEVLKQIRGMSHSEIMDAGSVSRVLGYAPTGSFLEQHVAPRGYRIIGKLPRIPMGIVRNMVMKFNYLQRILQASIEELDDVEGIGGVRARVIKEGLKRMQEQVLIKGR